MPLRRGTGTAFLFPKARTPSCADPHGMMHSTSLSPRRGGTICDRPSQPKVPCLGSWGFLHARRRDSSPLHHRGNVLPMECLCKDTSNSVPLFLCPAQLGDALHKPLGLLSASLSHHLLPAFSRILTQHEPRSTVAFLTLLQLKQPQSGNRKSTQRPAAAGNHALKSFFLHCSSVASARPA